MGHRLFLFPFLVVIIYDLVTLTVDSDLNSTVFLIISCTSTYFLSQINSIRLGPGKIEIINFIRVKEYDADIFEKIEPILPNLNFFFIKLKNGEKYAFAFFTSRFFLSLDSRRDISELTEKTIRYTSIPA